MFDQRLFRKALSRFSAVLPDHDLDAAALAELTKSVTAVSGLLLGGSVVTMAEKGQLQFVTAVSPDSKELERSQEEHREGPCLDAFETGEVVGVTDVRRESVRWPHYSAAATRLGLAGVAGILSLRDAPRGLKCCVYEYCAGNLGLCNVIRRAIRAFRDCQPQHARNCWYLLVQPSLAAQLLRR